MSILAAVSRCFFFLRPMVLIGKETVFSLISNLTKVRRFGHDGTIHAIKPHEMRFPDASRPGSAWAASIYVGEFLYGISIKVPVMGDGTTFPPELCVGMHMCLREVYFYVRTMYLFTAIY